MSVRVKNFGSSKKSNVSKEPIQFILEDQEFFARPEVPGAVLLRFMAAASQDDGAGAVTVVLPFFEKALEPESHERFEKLINDPDVNVELETLMEVLSWLIESYSNARPTKTSEQ